MNSTRDEVDRMHLTEDDLDELRTRAISAQPNAVHSLMWGLLLIAPAYMSVGLVAALTVVGTI